MITAEEWLAQQKNNSKQASTESKKTNTGILTAEEWLAQQQKQPPQPAATAPQPNIFQKAVQIGKAAVKPFLGVPKALPEVASRVGQDIAAIPQNVKTAAPKIAQTFGNVPKNIPGMVQQAGQAVANAAQNTPAAAQRVAQDISAVPGTLKPAQKIITEQIKGVPTGIEDTGKNLYKGLNYGAYRFWNSLDALAGAYKEGAPQIPGQEAAQKQLSGILGSIGIKDNPLKQLADSALKTAQNPALKTPDTVINKIWQGLGEAAVQIPQYLTGTKYFGLGGMPLVSGIQGAGAAKAQGKSTSKGFLQGAKEGAEFQAVLGVGGALPKVLSVPFVSAYVAIKGKLQGASLEDNIANSITMGILSLAGRNPTWEQFKDNLKTVKTTFIQNKPGLSEYKAALKNLGLNPKTATFDDLKAKHNELSKKYHPDKPSGDIKKFQEMQQNYETALKYKAFLKTNNIITRLYKTVKNNYAAFHNIFKRNVPTPEAEQAVGNLLETAKTGQQSNVVPPTGTTTRPEVSPAQLPAVSITPEQITARVNEINNNLSKLVSRRNLFAKAAERNPKYKDKLTQVQNEIDDLARERAALTGQPFQEGQTPSPGTRRAGEQTPRETVLTPEQRAALFQLPAPEGAQGAITPEQGGTPTPGQERPAMGEIPPELQPLAEEAKKYKTAEEFVKQDFQNRVIAGQDLLESIKGKNVNPDGTITLYHGTSKQAENNIFKSGKFNASSYFSIYKNGIKYGDSPLDVAKRKFGKDATVMEIKVDPRELELAAAGSEVFSPKELIKGQDGIWRAKGIPENPKDFYNAATAPNPAEQPVTGQITPSEKPLWDMTNEEQKAVADEKKARLERLKNALSPEDYQATLKDLYQDPLTKVWNRAKLMNDGALQDSKTKVLFLDIDFFKNFNDQFGHDTGDKVLYYDAQKLKQVAGDRGEVYRYGGEEFVIVPKSSADAAQIAKDLHSSINNEPIDLKRFGIEGEKITNSIGTAIGESNGLTSIEAADFALYVAKALGRNRVFDLEQLTPEIAAKTKQYWINNLHNAQKNLDDVMNTVLNGHSTLEAQTPGILSWQKKINDLYEILDKFDKILDFRENRDHNISVKEVSNEENNNGRPLRNESQNRGNVKTGRDSGQENRSLGKTREGAQASTAAGEVEQAFAQKFEKDNADLLKAFTPEQQQKIIRGFYDAAIPPNITKADNKFYSDVYFKLRKAGVKITTKQVKDFKIDLQLFGAEKIPELSTKEQKAKAHIIAKEKLYISRKGKPKPQYRRLAQAITGKKTMVKMTKEEANNFIDALIKLPNPVFRSGKLIPPSIPIKTRIVPQGYFNKNFKEPTPIRFFTSQTYYTQILGVKSLVEPLELAKQRFDLENRALSNAIDKQIQKLNKIGKITLKEKIKSQIKNQPTRAVIAMRELLDNFEEAPESLSPELKEIFNWFRNLNRSILKGENEVRTKLDLEPIKYRKAYVRHTAEAMAKEMLMGKYPFPEALKYWSQKIVGKKIFNPMSLQRQLADDLENYFTKDLAFATKSMVWTGLKEIHLSQPLKAFNEQLGALSKDLPVYENLSSAELKQIRETSVMPAATKKWLIDYVNQVIKGQETYLDAEVNRIVTNTGLGGILNKVLKPFGRTIGQRPITHIFQSTGRAIISGVMGWRPKQLIRNKFQLTQNLALYTIKANLKGFFPAAVDKNLKELLDKSLFLKTYTGFEELPTGLQKKLEKVWLAPYQWTAVSNVQQSMKVAYWDSLDLIINKKYAKYGWADPQRTYKEPKGFLYKSEKEKLLKEMEWGASATQFHYIPMSMPEIFRYKALIPFTRLQSWWMNYFTKFTREAIYRGVKGEPSWSEGTVKYPWNRRIGYLRYLLLGGAILISLGYKKTFLLGVLPTYMSPAAQLAIGIYRYIAASDSRTKAEAKRQIFYSWKAFIPGSLAWRDYAAVWTGKKPIESLFLYTSTKKEPSLMSQYNKLHTLLQKDLFVLNHSSSFPATKVRAAINRINKGKNIYERYAMQRLKRQALQRR